MLKSKRSLGCLFQLTVVAYDSTYPENEATATVSILVERNPHAPEFDDNNYQKTVDEKFALGSVVMEIRATDEDEVKTLSMNS